MARDQVAGAIILDRLREQIVSGLYLRYWSPGDRLPSIREIASSEQVDRKTAAAAYRRLQEEGLVRVRSRSGIYLSSPAVPENASPLERLHRSWLEHTYEGARALGLDTGTILRLITAIAEIERMRIPVVECDWAHAEAIAAELRERLQVRAMPYILEELRPNDPVLLEAPVLVTTPYHVSELGLVAPRRQIVEATLAPELLRELTEHAGQGWVLLIVASSAMADKLSRALRHCRVPMAKVEILPATDRAAVSVAAQQAAAIFLWPGAPASIEDSLPPGKRPIRPNRSVAADAVHAIQTAILDAAMRRFKNGARPEEVRVS